MNKKSGPNNNVARANSNNKKCVWGVPALPNFFGDEMSKITLGLVMVIVYAIILSDYFEGEE